MFFISSCHVSGLGQVSFTASVCLLMTTEYFLMKVSIVAPDRYVFLFVL